MLTVISGYSLLVWFVWGFFMGLGWTLAAWLMNKLLSALSS